MNVTATILLDIFYRRILRIRHYLIVNVIYCYTQCINQYCAIIIHQFSYSTISNNYLDIVTKV